MTIRSIIFKALLFNLALSIVISGLSYLVIEMELFNQSLLSLYAKPIMLYAIILMLLTGVLLLIMYETDDKHDWIDDEHQRMIDYGNDVGLHSSGSERGVGVSKGDDSDDLRI